MNNQPRYLYIEQAVVLGDPRIDPTGILLTEQPDGSWRSTTGSELVEIHQRFPDFVRSTQHPPEDR